MAVKLQLSRQAHMQIKNGTSLEEWFAIYLVVMSPDGTAANPVLLVHPA